MHHLVLNLEDHLVCKALQGELGRVSAELLANEAAPAGSLEAQRGLLIDCRKMTGYERPARDLFVDWNRDHRDQLFGVAVVTANPIYRMVVGAMSLASTQQMKAFDSETDANVWLSSLAPVPSRKAP